MAKASPRSIGLFVIGAIILILGAIAVLGSGNLFKTTYPFVSYFDGSVAGLDPGAPVKLRGVTIGQVREIRLAIPGDSRVAEDFRIPVLWEINRDLLVKHGGVGEVTPALIDTLIDAGMRATLEQESFVTGKKFIGLEILPNTDYRLEGVAYGDYREIPTANTGLSELQGSISALVAKISALDADSLIESLTNTIRSIEAVVSNPGLQAAAERLPRTLASAQKAMESAAMLMANTDSAVGPVGDRAQAAMMRADSAMLALEETLTQTRILLEAEGVTATRLNEALYEIGSAARAFRSLAETLDRNPSSLLRGKDYGESDQ
ncbi:MAG: MlaD family protein [marine benthic group bacterium]|jgi:paraquat-inducible protein B|nr:MlaD family protein [Gemmatimonadota bacterium]MCL7963575.1 MlaD family protein [Candidatus Carthagonibacter metallireducens]MCL7957359.1 MlaD family protein [Gemmatimonadota bacterium]MCL7966354.1 MlaD family protein [Gemmatimonadota bacterium]MCL7970230.1 MlaD family protein [Gemmatimonadota bacterium]